MTSSAQIPAEDPHNFGLTHFALNVSDIDATLAFYRKYAGMTCIHDRGSGPARVAWMSDLKHPVCIVLIQRRRSSFRRWLVRRLNLLRPALGHTGVALPSREDVDALCEQARREGILRRPPRDAGDPVNYYGMINDPDGNSLELSCGQVVSEDAARAAAGGSKDESAMGNMRNKAAELR